MLNSNLSFLLTDVIDVLIIGKVDETLSEKLLKAKNAAKVPSEYERAIEAL